MALTIIGIYLAIAVFIGVFSTRFLRKTGADFFVASRSMGPFVLLMSLFSTNMTAFAILGSSGETYKKGIGVFGLMASSSALVIPCLLFFVGTRLWSIGKRFGYVTQVQYFRDRWESNTLGTVIFFVLVFFSAPYILTGLLGGETIFAKLTGFDAKYKWIGSLVICVVVCVYTFLGGMRGANWVQTFQALLLLTFGALGFVAITHELGGFGKVMEEIGANKDASRLLARQGEISTWKWLSYTLIPLSVGMFPHMFIHLLTAKRLTAFKYTFVFYPVCIATVWLPSVLLGLIAFNVNPTLKSPTDINGALVELYNNKAGWLLAGLFGAGVCAAIMGSLDSHILCLGSMFTQDVVVHYRGIDDRNERAKVFIARLFVVGLLLAVFLMIRFVNARTIFSTGVWCFSAFSSLFPILLAALFWKRSTKVGAYLSTLSVFVLISFFYGCANFGANDEYTVTWNSLGTLHKQFDNSLHGIWNGEPKLAKVKELQPLPEALVTEDGIMPVAVVLPISALVLVVGSLLTRPPSAATLARFFPGKSADFVAVPTVDGQPAAPVPTPARI
jgi:SSS family solute:Na+ symporter